MESPGMYPDSPLDADEAVYPCKGCGEILEEGKAFELAGNRWHIDCFRCNTCKTLLDSDANLLLLGDGSLICNNCTYSCSACGNKIEDLAILTGDQAFCANCFKCRNCKRKIENLRYARTSQGIFCMSCHESLMARRRKKSKQTRMNSNTSNVFDKSLPALPQSAVSKNAFAPAPETETPPSEFYSETPSDMSPKPQRSSRRNDGSVGPPTKRSSSPADTETSHNDNVTLPASTYGSDNGFSYGQSDGANGGDDGFFIPMALDPNPAPGPSPMTQNSHFDPAQSHSQKASGDTEYMSKGARIPSATSNRDILKENGSRSSSVDRVRRDGSYNRQPASPHIAYQQKGRQPSADYMDARPRWDMSMESSPVIDTRTLQSQTSSAYTSQAASPSEFKLQDAPRARKGSFSKKSSKPHPSQRNTIDSQKSQNDAINRDIDMATTTSPASVEPSPLPDMEQRQFERPTRGDSLDRPTRGDSLGPQHRQAVTRKEVPNDSDGPATPRLAGQPTHERNVSAVSMKPRASPDLDESLAQPNGGRPVSKSADSDVAKTILDVPNLPARSTSRPSPLPGAGDSFVAPRAPPPPPSVPRHNTSGSISTVKSNMSGPLSPTLPRYSAGGDFTMEEEMGRILKGEQIDDREQSVLRKVSNAAKHMRSFSDRGSQATTKLRDHQFVRSPSVTNGSVDLSNISISSPTSATHEGKNTEQLRNHLRRMQKRNAELEAERTHLIDMLNNNQDVKAVNEDLKQKRSTMAFLDTQREIVVRELEVMTEHLKKAKESNQPLDVNQLKSDIMREFGSSLNSLKHELAGEIEDLIHKRNEITNEIADLIQMKDRGNQEYEDLSHRNQQLTSLNSELVSQIQKTYETSADKGKPLRPVNGLNGMSIGTPFVEPRSASSSVTSPNGLGIYQPQGQASAGLDASRTSSVDPSMLTLVNEDAEPAVMTAPHVVNIRKGRPNMWKKGSQAVAKNIRGIKGAFVSTNQYPDQRGYGGQMLTEGVPYGSMSEGARPNNNEISISGPMNVRRGDQAAYNNLFAQNQGKRLGKPGTPGLGMGMPNGSGTNVEENGLFGSDLSQRCQLEKQDIPSIVSSCIQEVEVRGMEVEGVYRKSGGSSQVNAIRVGFEKDNNYDVSDPDLDIHAVTSCLKQYFRRLPVPLITFDVYDALLDAAQISAHDEKLHEMRGCIETLPRAHRDVLSFLIFHLARVMAKEPQNLMSSLNLAVVFAPTIMRPTEIEREMTDMQAQRIAVQTLLENNQIIFGAN